MSDQEAKLRHEFVGMMFAITIGEVGLQVAALVQSGHPAHFLPAYAHLLLATVVVATSWVGWSLSVAPGARQDVRGIFQWEFVVLLLDVSLVITYFILVRTVDFSKERTPPRIDPASTVASWIVLIFILYFVWDCVTKILIYRKKPEGQWLKNYGSRMLPTVVCLVVACTIQRKVQTADLPHRLTADFALISVVLLFRALKDLASACFPREVKSPPVAFFNRAKLPVLWTLVCATGITGGVLWTTHSWPLPLSEWIVKEIQTPLPGDASTSEISVPQVSEH